MSTAPIPTSVPQPTTPTRPLVSVLTAVGRREPDYLRAAGQSIAELSTFATKDGSGVEWIVALDRDNDLTVAEIASDIADVPVRKFITTNEFPHTGPGPARNAALRIAAGYWTYVLDSDDTINVPGLQDMIIVATRTQMAWAAGKTYQMTADMKPKWAGPADPWGPGVIQKNAYWQFRMERGGQYPVMPNATIIRTDVLKQIGGWADLRKNEDVAMMCVLSAHHEGVWVPSYCHNYRQHPQSLTHAPDWNALSENDDLIAEWMAAGRIPA